MKVIERNKQRGIFIPAEEWADVAKTVSRDSALYRLMDQQLNSSIFDISISDISKKLEVAASNLTQSALDAGFYTSHPIKNSGQFLHRYADNRIELIEIDETTGEQKILKVYH